MARRGTRPPVPAELKSLYRLFLRATSAAVLHNGPTTRQLRRLYRPTFDAAAYAARKLVVMPPNVKEAVNVRNWLKTFDRRINNTLAFLHTSSLSRGLSSKVVANINRLSFSNYPWTVDRILEVSRRREWNPKLDPRSPEYSRMPPTLYDERGFNKKEKTLKELDFNKKCWGALGEVVQLAEARDGLVFGRVKFQMEKFKKKKFY